VPETSGEAVAITETSGEAVAITETSGEAVAITEASGETIAIAEASGEAVAAIAVTSGCDSLATPITIAIAPAGIVTHHCGTRAARALGVRSHVWAALHLRASVHARTLPRTLRIQLTAGAGVHPGA